MSQITMVRLSKNTQVNASLAIDRLTLHSKQLSFFHEVNSCKIGIGNDQSLLNAVVVDILKNTW